jgi:nicotinate-nucleotide adenylyltransferase
VLVVPVFEHALKKPHASFEQRLEMCRVALGFLPSVEICAIEGELRQPSYTLRTLEQISADHPDWALRLVIGSDVLFETHKWHAFERVAALAPPFVLGRVGSSHPSAPCYVLPDISSSRVRGLAGRRADRRVAEELGRFVPASVIDFMDEHGLYR